jgi:hypothetical protein
MYRWVLRFIDQKIEGLVYGDTLQRWVPYFPEYAETIRKTLENEWGIRFEPGEFPFMSFTDCNQTKTRTPGSGPAEEGRHAAHHEDAKLLDEASYTRYGKIHGLKTMNIVFPNGIIPWMYGPVSVRENDLGVMNLSDLDQYLVNLQPDVTAALAEGDDVDYFSTYGDRIFGNLRAINSARQPPIGGVLEPIDKSVNKAMSSQRQSVEWPYAVMENMFKILQTPGTPYWRLL